MRAFGRGRAALGLELVGELAELVEIDARPEAERMRYGPGHGATTRSAQAWSWVRPSRCAPAAAPAKACQISSYGPALADLVEIDGVDLAQEVG